MEHRAFKIDNSFILYIHHTFVTAETELSPTFAWLVSFYLLPPSITSEYVMLAAVNC